MAGTAANFAMNAYNIHSSNAQAGENRNITTEIMRFAAEQANMTRDASIMENTRAMAIIEQGNFALAVNSGLAVASLAVATAMIAAKYYSDRATMNQYREGNNVASTGVRNTARKEAMKALGRRTGMGFPIIEDYSRKLFNTIGEARGRVFKPNSATKRHILQLLHNESIVESALESNSPIASGNASFVNIMYGVEPAKARSSASDFGKYGMVALRNGVQPGPNGSHDMATKQDISSIESAKRHGYKTLLSPAGYLKKYQIDPTTGKRVDKDKYPRLFKKLTEFYQPGNIGDIDELEIENLLHKHASRFRGNDNRYDERRMLGNPRKRKRTREGSVPRITGHLMEDTAGHDGPFRLAPRERKSSPGEKSNKRRKRGKNTSAGSNIRSMKDLPDS